MNQTLTNWFNSSETSSLSTRDNSLDFRIFFSMITYLALFCCGAVLNIMVVFVMLRSGKVRQNISSFLIFHLSLTHLLYLPISWLRILIISRAFPDSASCKASVLIELTCAAAIFNSLVAIAWDRHRNVLRPFKSLAPRHLKTYLMLVAAIWAYAFITSAPFFYSIRTESVVICSKQSNGTESCQKKYYCSSYLLFDRKTQLSKTIYFLLAFVIPLMYIFFAYTKIAVSLWKRSKNKTIHGAIAKCKVKSTRLSIVAVLGFVLCWGPTFWIDLLTVYRVVDLSFMRWISCLIMQTSSSVVNPAIYAFCSPEFRKHFVKFCCCCCRCCSSRKVSHRGHLGHANRVQSVL